MDSFEKTRTNKWLYEDMMKYKRTDFSFKIIETCDKDELLVRERWWMDYYANENPDLCYNWFDNFGENNPNYGNYWSDEQKANMGKIKSAQHSSGEIYGSEWKTKIAIASSNMWKDKSKKARMAEKVSEAKTIYSFTQLTRDGKLVRQWDSMKEILSEHPDYHVQAIYSCCSGYKKTYRGFRWLKRPKI